LNVAILNVIMLLVFILNTVVLYDYLLNVKCLMVKR
jgi:hypothetical protein